MKRAYCHRMHLSQLTHSGPAVGYYMYQLWKIAKLGIGTASL